MKASLNWNIALHCSCTALQHPLPAASLTLRWKGEETRAIGSYPDQRRWIVCIFLTELCWPYCLLPRVGREQSMLDCLQQMRRVCSEQVNWPKILPDPEFYLQNLKCGFHFTQSPKTNYRARSWELLEVFSCFRKQREERKSSPDKLLGIGWFRTLNMHIVSKLLLTKGHTFSEFSSSQRNTKINALT